MKCWKKLNKKGKCFGDYGVLKKRKKVRIRSKVFIFRNRQLAKSYTKAILKKVRKKSNKKKIYLIEQGEIAKKCTQKKEC